MIICSFFAVCSVAGIAFLVASACVGCRSWLPKEMKWKKCKEMVARAKHGGHARNVSNLSAISVRHLGDAGAGFANPLCNQRAPGIELVSAVTKAGDLMKSEHFNRVTKNLGHEIDRRTDLGIQNVVDPGSFANAVQLFEVASKNGHDSEGYTLAAEAFEGIGAQVASEIELLVQPQGSLAIALLAAKQEQASSRAQQCSNEPPRPFTTNLKHANNANLLTKYTATTCSPSQLGAENAPLTTVKLMFVVTM